MFLRPNHPPFFFGFSFIDFVSWIEALDVVVGDRGEPSWDRPWEGAGEGRGDGLGDVFRPRLLLPVPLET